MPEPLDERYLAWLYARIGSVKETRPSRTYWKLFKLLLDKEFVWLIANDDNRVEDGRYMRYEFLDENALQAVDPDWLGMGCSVLELIFGLATRLAFEADRTPHYWFWELMANLDYIRQTDRNFNAEEVDDIAHALMYRLYSPDGSGGLFPLREPDKDQRTVEIWYAMQSYVMEQS